MFLTMDNLVTWGVCSLLIYLALSFRLMMEVRRRRSAALRRGRRLGNRLGVAYSKTASGAEPAASRPMAPAPPCTEEVCMDPVAPARRQAMSLGKGKAHQHSSTDGF